jgi:ubiquinone/menaquinone biosynthesis C-methylase UbiE
MTPSFRRTHFLLPVAFVLLLTALVSAQTVLQESWERHDNERQPPIKVMDALGIKPGMTIGEVGAGRGRYTVYLADRVGPAGKVYAEDIDRESLDVLRDRLKRTGLANTEVILGEVEDPLFPKSSLDVVLMVLSYHHLARPVALLKNLIPCLKPGAIVAVLDPDAVKDPGSRASEYTSKEKIEPLRPSGQNVLTVSSFQVRGIGPKESRFQQLQNRDPLA